VFLQRLYSTFGSGWPGLGLFLQRLLTAAVLFHSAIAVVTQSEPLPTSVPQLLAALAGIFLLAGFWTPVAGALLAVVEVWIILSGRSDPLIPVMLATLGATLAMLGPGAWSVDARLFGRKHIEAPHH
jgi:putative oxidoreductase